MLILWNTLFILLCFYSSVGKELEETAPVIEYYYWNVDPFYHMRKVLLPHGMLHESFKKANIFCNNIQHRSSCKDKNGSSLEFQRNYVNFIKVGIGHKVFHDIVFKPNRLDLVKRPNYTSTCNKPVLQIWGVIYMGKSNEWINEKLKDLTTFEFTVSKYVAVVMRRNSIDLLNKVGRGIKNCLEIVVLSVLFAFVFGMILWIFEHRDNENVNSTFVSGCQDTIWCSFVSMTTVGYGDISPVTVFGRLSMTLWITVGLIMISSMVGVVFEAVSSPPDVHGKALAVIPNTTAERFARDSLSGTIIHGPTNRAIFKEVIAYRADAAIINSDVYAEYQTIFRKDSLPVPLHVVKEYKVDQPILMTFNKDQISTNEGKQLYECLTKTYKELIFDIPVLQYPVKLRVDTIHYTGFGNFSLYILILMLGLLVICLPYGYCLERRRGKNGQTSGIELDRLATENDIIVLDGDQEMKS